MTEEISKILKNHGIDISKIVKKDIPEHSETEITPFHSTLGQLAQSLHYSDKTTNSQNTNKLIKLTNTYLGLIRDFETYKTEQFTPEIKGNEEVNETLTNYILRKEEELRHTNR